ncbi:MAG: nitrogen fixation protein [Acidobacteriota bacterium]
MNKEDPLCPSARPETPGARIFAVIDRSGETPRARYLSEPVPFDEDAKALLGGAAAGEVFRLGARCAGAACQHFANDACSLGERLVQLVQRPREASLPSCALRPACRWFSEQGPRACVRCEWVVSEDAALEGSGELRERVAST